ncbi:hypothetical protein BDF14DRAFT_1999290 [Spinellus fusiger]|nr:hypothetical protein BDF14DRAFT_1999290 [Spinellus fusiger]
MSTSYFHRLTHCRIQHLAQFHTCYQALVLEPDSFIIKVLGLSAKLQRIYPESAYLCTLHISLQALVSHSWPSYGHFTSNIPKSVLLQLSLAMSHGTGTKRRCLFCLPRPSAKQQIYVWLLYCLLASKNKAKGVAGRWIHKLIDWIQPSDLNQRGWVASGETLMHTAAWCGNVSILQHMIQRGGNMQLSGYHGYTPIWIYQSKRTTVYSSLLFPTFEPLQSEIVDKTLLPRLPLSHAQTQTQTLYPGRKRRHYSEENTNVLSPILISSQTSTSTSSTEIAPDGQEDLHTTSIPQENDPSDSVSINKKAKNRHGKKRGRIDSGGMSQAYDLKNSLASLHIS